MRFIFNLVRFLVVGENRRYRNRHAVFFDEGGGVHNYNQRGEAWLTFFEWAVTIVAMALFIWGIVALAGLCG